MNLSSERALIFHCCREKSCSVPKYILYALRNSIGEGFRSCILSQKRVFQGGNAALLAFAGLGCSRTLQVPLHPGTETGPPEPVRRVPVLDLLPSPVPCSFGICLFFPVAFYDVIWIKMAKGKPIKATISTNINFHCWYLRLPTVKTGLAVLWAVVADSERFKLS